MAQLFQQLQPFEENQSPSPTYEHPDPFLSLSRSRSSHNSSSDTPSSPIANLHRQLSGDPDAPPPAWKRRSSFTQKSPTKEVPGNPGVARSPSARPAESERAYSNGPPPARRHPTLTMTTATRPPVPNGMFTHDSPSGSSTSLYDPTFAPPQPAFLRKRGGTGSNRSSIHSMDTSGMTSEDLWNLESEPIADLNNPQRNAMERPLDTIRRLSQRSERPSAVSPYSPSGLPVDFMWPTAPPEEETMPMRRKSKSTTNVPAMARAQSRLIRKKTGRQTSADPQMINQVMNPASADIPSNSVFISSAHSSSTDLTKTITGNKSLTHLGSKPPSTYYSRDFLSQLAPREGGYAIAAMLSSPGTPGTQSQSQSDLADKRRSANLEAHRGSRPPTSRSAGMGRWSLDGGEHYNRPYGSTSSANTTTSNLSAPPINSPEPSPPADDHISLASILPEGASPATTIRSDALESSPVVLASAPNNPSPLSRAVTQDAVDTPPIASDIPVPPIPALDSRPALSTRQSKKQLAKEAKAIEKAETAKLAADRAKRSREDAAKKQAEKDKERHDKESTKKKEREEKEKKKSEKKRIGSGFSLKNPSQPALVRSSPQPQAQPSVSSSNGTSNTAINSNTGGSSSQGDFKPASQSPVVMGTRRNISMPTGSSKNGPMGGEEPKKVKLGLFGTLRKRFSGFDSSSQKGTSAPRQPSTTMQARSAPPAPMARPHVVPVATPATVPPVEPLPIPIPPQDEVLSPAPLEDEVVVIDRPATPQGTDKELPHAVAAAEDLPPRTTSMHQQSPSIPITSTPSRGSIPAQSDLSHSPSPPSGGTTLRSRNSIQGPRPMPRSASITSRERTPTQASVPLLDTGVNDDFHAGLSQTQSHLTGSSGTYESQVIQTPSSLVGHGGGEEHGRFEQQSVQSVHDGQEEGGVEVGRADKAYLPGSDLPGREDSMDTIRGLESRPQEIEARS